MIAHLLQSNQTNQLAANKREIYDRPCVFSSECVSTSLINYDYIYSCLNCSIGVLGGAYMSVALARINPCLRLNIFSYKAVFSHAHIAVLSVLSIFHVGSSRSLYYLQTVATSISASRAY